jgi:hypothetical protein
MKILLKYTQYFFVPLFLVLIGCPLENQVLLTIDDEKYTVADFKERMPLAPADDSVRRLEKLNDYVNQMLMVREARERGYADDPAIQTTFESQKKDILSRGYYEDKVINKAKVSDSEIRKLYNKIVDKYHLAQIVVDQDSLAQYIEGELRKGVPFDSLLRFSLDTLSEGGDIGEFSAMSIPPEIFEPLSKTREGDVTDAIQLGEFFYFLKVIGHEKSDTPTYEEIKENIKNNLLRDKAGEIGDKLIEKLIAEAKIEYDQEGLDALIKPDSLLTEEDLDKWVVKKYDTAYVYVRTLREAVYQQYKRSSIDPQILIERVLVPDLIYDKVIKERYDKRPEMKRRLRTVISTLMHQRFYTDEIVNKATVDSAEVVEYYETHGDEYKDKELKDVFVVVRTTIRDAKIDTLRQNLFNNLREKYKPEVNEAVVARLLREEK